nr:hypothetical protein [Gammaproteobacteria bacterium]
MSKMGEGPRLHILALQDDILIGLDVGQRHAEVLTMIHALREIVVELKPIGARLGVPTGLEIDIRISVIVAPASAPLV